MISIIRAAWDFIVKLVSGEWMLKGQANGGVWRHLGTTTADVRGYAHYGPIHMTNALELFRAWSP